MSYDVYNQFKDKDFEELKTNILEDIEQAKATEDLIERRKILKAAAEKSMAMNELLIFALIKETDNFFGNVTIQLNRRIDFGCKAPAAVAYKGLHFDLIINPALLYKYTLAEMKAILIHECYHIICKHLPRTLPLFKKYPQTILNLATDCAINQYINGLPDGCVTPQSLKSQWKVKGELELERESEYYIKRLLEEYKDNEDFKQQVDNQENQKGQGGGEGQGQGGGEGPKPGDPDYDGTNGPLETEEQYGDAHGSWEESDQSQNMENADDVVKDILNQAQAKSRGRIPSKVVEAIAKLNEKPIISWQEELRRYTGQLSKPYKKTITRKSRRQPERADLRGRLNDHVVEIVVAIDTSGSMDNKTIEYCLNEVFAIAKYQETKITVIECDCNITRVYEAKTPRDIKKDVTGRGGTSFQPVFDYLKENRKRNVVLIYFTDGYGEYALKERPICYRTLWVLTGRSEELSLREPYGKVKQLRLDEKWKKMQGR